MLCAVLNADVTGLSVSLEAINMVPNATAFPTIIPYKTTTRMVHDEKQRVETKG
jgi:hypothetical protein